MKNKIYIFGSNGFIGKEFLKYILINFKNKNNKFLTDDSQIISIDKKHCNLLQKKSSLFISKKIKDNSTIVFFAGIKKQLGDSLKIYNDNMKLFINFVSGIENKSNLHIIFISSAAVYGEDINHKNKINENTKVNIRSFYACAKINSEFILKKICYDKGFKSCILRLPLVYGYYDKTLGYGPTKFFFNFIKKENITLWGDGSEYREFIYVKDIPPIITHLINTRYEGLINIASSFKYNYLDILKHLNKLDVSDFYIQSKKRSKLKVDHFFDNSKFKSLLPRFRFTKLNLALKDMFSIYKQRKW
tara:strand:- start:7628 stop:8536 length:909 start_codon:yes stop_codon:yes gene_type:complete